MIVHTPYGSPLISVYKDVFDVADDLTDIISREADGDWSLVQYHCAVSASEHFAQSECGPLALLRTEMNDSFISYMRGIIGDIEQQANESLDDYLTSHGIKSVETHNYDLIRITNLTGANRSVVLGDRLQEGIAVEVCCLSEVGSIYFPSLDEELELSAGSVVYAPGGFPYEHQLCSNDQTTYLKRVFR